MADVVIKGGKELHNFLQQLPVKMERNVMRAGLRAGAKVIADEAKQNVPVDDGDLKASIRVSTRARKGQVTASAKAGSKKAWYWRFVEFGTAAHFIKVSDIDRPVNLRRSAKLGRLARVSISTINRKSLLIGANFIGPSVHHPGSRAKPFMRPAFDAKSNDAIRAVGRKIGERLTKAGLNAPSFEVGDE